MRLRTILLVLAFLTVFSACAGGYLYYISLRQSAFEEGKRRTILYAERAKNRFDSFLSEYLKSVKVLSGLTELVQAVSSPGEDTLAEANLILDHFRDALGVNVCYLMNFEGTTIASSNRDSPRSFVGRK